MKKLEKILVTGATGFIGTRVCELLIEKGIPTRALVRSREKAKKLLGHLPNIELAVGSLEDPSSLTQALAGVDAVIHLAGAIQAKNEKGYQTANAQGTDNLLKAAAAQNARLHRFVLVSSLAAGGPATGPEPIHEAMQANPVSAYGRSKLLAEQHTKPFETMFPITIVRPPIVYGPRDAAFFVILKAAARGWALDIRARSPYRNRLYSAIFVDDLAEALILCAQATEQQSPSGAVYYVQGDEPVPMTSITRQVGAVLQRRVRHIPLRSSWLQSARTLLGKVPGVPDKIHEVAPDFWICSGEKIKRDLGFEPKMKWKEGLRHTLSWYQESGWLPREVKSRP